jgi:hypothetical protein
MILSIANVMEAVKAVYGCMVNGMERWEMLLEAQLLVSMIFYARDRGNKCKESSLLSWSETFTGYKNSGK